MMVTPPKFMLASFVIFKLIFRVKGLEYTIKNKAGEYEGLDLSIGAQDSIDFSIKMCRDAYVCLSSNKGDCTDSAYILEIGSSDNTKLVIRQCTATVCDKLSSEKQAVLDCQQFVAFTVSFAGSKLIVTAAGNQLVNLNIDSPVTVSYVDFSNEEGSGVIQIDRGQNLCLIPDSETVSSCVGNRRPQCVNRGCCWNDQASPRCYTKYVPTEETTTTITTLAPTTTILDVVETTTATAIETTTTPEETTTTPAETPGDATTSSDTTATTPDESDTTTPGETATGTTEMAETPTEAPTVAPCVGNECYTSVTSTTTTTTTTRRAPRPPFLIITGGGQRNLPFTMMMTCTLSLFGQWIWRNIY